MNKKLKLISIGLIGLSLCSCAAAVIGGTAVGTGVAVGTDDRGTKTVYNDQSLGNRAKDIATAINSKGSYTISSYNGIILLAGQVPTQSDKDKIYSSVKNMSGIAGVNNYLEVGKNQSMGQITEDTYLTSTAKSRLIAQKDVNTNNIKVVTCNGVVYLMGDKAGNSAQIAGAVNGIKEINGVKKVVNLIN